MRIFVLFGLVGFGLAACESPYGPDSGKVTHDYSLSTGSHIRGNSSGNVQAVSGDGLTGNSGTGGSSPGIGIKGQ